MSIFRGKALRRNRFSKIVRFIISLAVVFNISSLGVFLSPISVQAAVSTIQPPAADARIWEKHPDTNYGSSSYLKVRSHKGGDNQQSLVAFNLSSIPAGSTINSASLKLYMYDAPPESRTYGAYRATESWVQEGVTWNTQPSINGSATDTAEIGTTNRAWIIWDVTSDVQSFINGTTNNYGWLIKDETENNIVMRDAKFRSKECSDTTDRPKLIVNFNNPPIADAGPDQTTNEGTLVIMDGSGSSDPNGDPLTYSWTQTGGPAVTLANSTTVTPAFTAPFVFIDTALTFKLTVSDGLATDEDTVSIMIQNSQNDSPIADAGPDQTTNEGTLVIMDGSGSSDPNGDPLTYSWTQTGGPAVTLSDAMAVQPIFTAPDVSTDTIIAFQLTVSDGVLTSSDTVDVLVKDVPVLTPNISVTKTADKISVQQGDSLKYKIHVANTGTGAASGVTVSDNVPDGLKIDGVGCSVSGGATCNITSTANPVQVTGDLPADSFFDVFVDVTVKSDAAAGIVKNTATVTHSGSGFSGSFSDSGLSITSLPVVQPVNAKPVANAHGPYEAVLKDGKAEVSLVGTGTDTDGSIVKYEWDFEGDGIFDLAILASPTVTNGSVFHIYTKAGSYNPVLRVTDDKGATATDTTKAMILSHGSAVLFDVGPDGLTIAADGQLALFATATDSLGNSWDATADTVFTANDPCGAISQSVYLPCQAGEWEIQAAYQALTDKIGVKVVAGELNRLEISPYAKPFKIRENKSQVFTVKGFDADNNEVTILDPEWSTTGEKVAIGKIDKNGKFLATHGGIGRVTAKSGELSASVGIIVKEVKAAAPVKKKPAAVATAGTGGEEPVSDQAGEPAESDLTEEEPVVSSEETKPAEDDEEANGTVAGEEEQACTTLPWWVWYLLAAFYAIFLIIYYMNLRRLDKEHGMVRNWWAIPLLLTGVMLGIYFLYRCPGVFLRWPWALILGGVIISAVYYQSREPEDLPPAGSAMGGDNNIKSI